MLYEVEEDNLNYMLPSPSRLMQEQGADPEIFKQIVYMCNPGTDKYDGNWKVIKIYLETVTGKDLKRADASGMMGKLFFTEQALEILKQDARLKEFFDNPDFGEFVEVSYDDNGESVKGFFFNPAVTLESKGIAVDSMEDQYSNTLTVTPRIKDFPVMLFKTMENITTVYCTQVFKKAFESSNLTGLIFKEAGHEIDDDSVLKLS